ncbi:hypothetical protein F4861DRAFT_490614 [Xylaria intraflava]|nr:hypothetical protein F4861DRAFT_490614 [Xylaria intraflava]
MSDDTSAQSAAAQPAETPSVAAVTDNGSAKPVAPVADAKAAGSDESVAAMHDSDKAAEGEDKSEDKVAAPAPSAAPAKSSAPTDEDATATATATDGDVETEDKSATKDDDAVADSETAANATADDATPTTAKSQPRRKSASAADKSKKLSKKASKAKILHVDAKPGDHYFAKLKGFPPWPVVICEEDMLPQNMLNSRPVTAARPDGTYREDFADGAKRVADRTFPVMYLHTNEFSWIPNTDLTGLDPSTVTGLITAKMRKDLQSAHELAAKSHNLDYYKDVLREFEEQRLAKNEPKKSKPKTPKKSSKPTDEDGDMEMIDVGDEAEEPSKKKSKSKKRKAEDENSTPQRSDSVKKPKIKLTSTATPKSANGVQSPAAKDSAKPSKAKAKAAKGSKDADGKKEKEPVVPKEPELTHEERRARKEKEILFLRHRLQRGLLPREGQPVPAEMKQVSDFLAKLETFPDLDVGIIRATKINKVLKAILKLESIPREDEFQFKPRSQVLLDKWNILLASDGVPAPATASSSANANGVNGTATTAKASKETANGTKEGVAEGKAVSEKNVAKADSAEHEGKESIENKDAPTKDEAADTEEQKPTEPTAATAKAEASA